MKSLWKDEIMGELVKQLLMGCTKGDGEDTVLPHMTVEVPNRKEEHGQKRFGNKDLRALKIEELIRI